MRVLCLNCNRRSERLSDNILQKNADIVLLQEWISHKKDQSSVAKQTLKKLGNISSTRYLVTSSNKDHTVLYNDDRILISQHNKQVIVNTYFPAGKTSDRIFHMEKLSKVIQELNLEPTLIAGDFNLAPRLEDGWYGDEYSNFTKRAERIKFQELLTVHQLSDMGSSKEWAPTFERQIRGRSSRFRCDLFLLRSDLLKQAELSYDHKFRTEEGYSDHSALILELEL